MNFTKFITNKFIRYLIHQNLVIATLLVTLISIIVSLMMTYLVSMIFTNGLDTAGISIAIIVPGLIAPVFSFVFLGILKELDQTRSELGVLAVTDELTGAYNRRKFIEIAQREISQTHPNVPPLSIILFDCDDFKNINDTHGHPCGDMVLQQISQICQKMIRRQDIFARYGGEEFIILLPETDSIHALAVAERLRETIANQKIGCDEKTISTTVSVGISTLQESGVDFDELLKRVDRAVYKAKEAGKNCVVVQ